MVKGKSNGNDNDIIDFVEFKKIAVAARYKKM